MDVDSRSPPLQQQPIRTLLPSPRLNELEKAFNDPSPIPVAKKRLIHDDPSSPLSSARPALSGRPVLEKAATTTSIFTTHSSRRRTISRRPSHSSVKTAGAAAALSEESTKPVPSGLGLGVPRDAIGRRPCKARRAQSECDPPSLFGAEMDADESEDIDDVSSPSVKPPRRAAHSSAGSIEEEAMSGTVGRRVQSMDHSQFHISQSPSEFHFGSEAEGKILPCFSVKEDGLMRITPATVRFSLSLIYRCARPTRLRLCVGSLSIFWRDGMMRS
jgi:M-phase inducer tyrosine phosphatase